MEFQAQDTKSNIFCLFVCFKGGSVHLAWQIESVFAEFPVDPEAPSTLECVEKGYLIPFEIKL